MSDPYYPPGCHKRITQFLGTTKYADPLYGEGPTFGSASLEPLLRVDLGDFG